MIPTETGRILPESVITRTAEQRLPSRIGLLRRHMVSVGRGTDGREYVQLGSRRQVGAFIYVERESEAKITPEFIFRLQNDHLPDEFLAEPRTKEMPIEEIRRSVEEGQELVEGIFAVVSRPGEPSIVAEEGRGVWAPVEVALGDKWKLT